MPRSKSDLVSEIVQNSLTRSGFILNQCCLCEAKNIDECKIGKDEFSIHWSCLKLAKAIAELDDNYK